MRYLILRLTATENGSYRSYSEGSGRISSTFVLDKSKGFTHVGVSRLHGSIRIYVWAHLGAQSQTSSRIVGVGTYGV